MSKLKTTAKATAPKPKPQVTVEKVTPVKTGGGGKAVQKPMPKGPSR